MDQFITLSGGFGAGGKKQKIYTSMRNAMENALTAKPYLPRLNLRMSNGSFRYLLTQTHDIETMYDESSALTPSEVMLLYAVRLPMLMSESRVEMVNVSTIDLSGISGPLGTYTYQWDDHLRGISVLTLGEEARERNSIISRKRRTAGGTA
jgi:hypothetical protein